MAMKNLLEKSDFDNRRLFARIDRFRAYYTAKIWNAEWHASPEVFEALAKW